MTELPEYDAPPVVETVLGVQFAALPLTAAHAGWFWQECLGQDWPVVREAPRLEDVFERFGTERVWKQPGFRVSAVLDSPRIQVIRADEERMVQVQNSRFVYNWQKQSSAYPTYRTLLPEFQQHFEHFEGFLRRAKLPDLVLNQWEVVYVNHIFKGDLWMVPRDWAGIFTGFHLPTDQLEFEGSHAAWTFVIERDAGRLHIELRHTKKRPDGEEMIRLQLTARGPVSDGSKEALFAGFDVGHRTIVNAFTRMTSDFAQTHWKRRK